MRLHRDANLLTALQTIGEWAFEGCENMMSVNIPASVVSIGECAFSNACTNGIYVDKNNSHYASDNGILLDKNKTTLIQYARNIKNSSYSVPDSVESIATGAFYACDNLEKVTLPDSLRSIGSSAFFECKGLDSVTIPDSVTEIGDNSVFGQCLNLRSVKTGKGLKTIGNNMFWGCMNLREVTIAGEVERIEAGAFAECSALESISLPETLTFIGERAFEKCEKLAVITIPDSVTELEPWIFRECRSLVSATIGDNVTVIPEGMFQDCSALTSITLPHKLEIICGGVFDGFENPEYNPDSANRILTVYYNGTPDEWNQFEKHSITRVKMRYICWVYLYDNEGNFLYKAKEELNDTLSASSLPKDEKGNYLKVYNDPALSNQYDDTTAITENLTLYMKRTEGTKTFVSSEGENVEQQVMFTIKGMHMREGSIVILALYNNGRFAGVQDAVYYHGDIIFKTDIEHTTAKVMVWDENGMRPVHRSETVHRN